MIIEHFDHLPTLLLLRIKPCSHYIRRRCNRARWFLRQRNFTYTVSLYSSRRNMPYAVPLDNNGSI